MTNIAHTQLHMNQTFARPKEFCSKSSVQDFVAYLQLLVQVLLAI